MPPALNLTPEKIAVYRGTAHRRREQDKPVLARRREQAWAAARQAAQLLRDKFKATRVVVFGSLARDSGAVMGLETEVPVNLVDVNTCRPSLLSAIEQDWG